MLSLVFALSVQGTYTAIVEEVGGDRKIVVRHVKSRKVLWSRWSRLGTPHWSPSRRALIAMDGDWSLFYWRVGERVKKFKISNPFSDGNGEPPGFDPIWSPDEKRVLLRVPGSMGSESLNIGALISFRVSTGRSVLLSDVAGTPKWAGKRTVIWDDIYPREVPQPWKIVPRKRVVRD